MKTIPSVHPYYAHRSGSALGKAVATIASILAIAAIIFIGTRDWKSEKNILSTLIDVSDIRGLFKNVEETAFNDSAKQEAISKSSNAIEQNLIEKGTLIRRDTQIFGNSATPAGLTRTSASR